MRENKLTVRINKSVPKVFAFLLNPENTPFWINSIAKEEVNEKPTKLGTIYRNVDKNGKWSKYSVTAYEENKLFVFTSEDKNYSVKYTFRHIDDNVTELEYYEWAEKGDLEEPFSQEILNKLKSVLES